MAQYDINLREYFRIIRRRRGIVILVPLLFAFSAFTLAFFQAPKPLYQATAVDSEVFPQIDVVLRHPLIRIEVFDDQRIDDIAQ